MLTEDRHQGFQRRRPDRDADRRAAAVHPDADQHLPDDPPQAGPELPEHPPG